MTFTNSDKFECLQREIKMRKRVFPRRVQQGKMKQAEADREIACMEAIAEDYKPIGKLI